MGRLGLTGRLAWLVQAMLVLGGLTYVVQATVHSWPAALFMGGFLAVLGTGGCMIYLVRLKKDRAARWPLFIAAVGVFAGVIMMSHDPQPLLATGCVDIGASVAAWSVYRVIRALAAGSATRASSERQDTPA
jgi:hypothetical protein